MRREVPKWKKYRWCFGGGRLDRVSKDHTWEEECDKEERMEKVELKAQPNWYRLGRPTKELQRERSLLGLTAFPLIIMKTLFGDERTQRRARQGKAGWLGRTCEIGEKKCSSCAE